MNLHNVQFIKSAAGCDDIINDTIPKIVFSGKSNVGKSSVINRLLNRKQFARVSATPGKTIHINYYFIDNTAYFVDLPGYGYAKAAKTEYVRWSKLMECFFSDPGNVTFGIMIVDARHKPTKDDVTMARWFISTGKPFIVIANKTDKVKMNTYKQNTQIIRSELALPDDTDVIMFSALKGVGRDVLLDKIKEILSIGSAQ